MFPFIRDSGPFLNLLPFPTGGNAAPAPAITVGPTWTDNGDGTATVTFTTSIAATGGIDYGASSGVYTASSMTFTPTTTFNLTVPESPGTEFGAWYWRIYLITAAGFSGYVGAEEFDSISPVLSSATDGTPTTTGATSATVDTNCGTGTIYWCLVTNGGSATNAQIIAGTGGNIVAGTADSQSVVATGTQTFDVTGAAAATTYQIKTLHVASGAESNQDSVSLVTIAAGNDYALSANIWAKTANSGTTITRTLPGVPAAGSLAVCFGFLTGSETVSSLVDDFGDGVSWTEATNSPFAWTNLGSGPLVCYYKFVGTPSGGGSTVTLTKSGTGSGEFYTATYTVSGIGSLDGTATVAQGNSAAPAPGAITKTAKGLVLGFAQCVASQPTAQTSPAYTKQASSNGLLSSAVEDLIPAAGGSFNPDWTAASQQWAAMGIAFK